MDERKDPRKFFTDSPNLSDQEFGVKQETKRGEWMENFIDPCSRYLSVHRLSDLQGKLMWSMKHSSAAADNRRGTSPPNPSENFLTRTFSTIKSCHREFVTIFHATENNLVDRKAVSLHPYCVVWALRGEVKNKKANVM